MAELLDEPRDEPSPTLDSLPSDILDGIIGSCLGSARADQQRAAHAAPQDAPEESEGRAWVLRSIRAIAQLGGCCTLLRAAVLRFKDSAELRQWRDELCRTVPDYRRNEVTIESLRPSTAAVGCDLEQVALCQAIALMDSLRQGFEAAMAARILRRHRGVTVTIEAHGGHASFAPNLAAQEARQRAHAVRVKLAEHGIDVTQRCSFFAWGNHVLRQLAPGHLSDAVGSYIDIELFFRHDGIEYPPRPWYYGAEGVERPRPLALPPEVALQLRKAALAARKAAASMANDDKARSKSSRGTGSGSGRIPRVHDAMPAATSVQARSCIQTPRNRDRLLASQPTRYAV